MINLEIMFYIFRELEMKMAVLSDWEGCHGQQQRLKLSNFLEVIFYFNIQMYM